MAATILFDQVGLPAGVPGRARSDGLDTGATVTITNASGQPCRVEFWWIPPDDTVAALSQNSPIQWEFDPEAARYGEYIIRMIEAEGTASETEDIKSFGVRLPVSGLLITGFNSKGDFDVNLASSATDKTNAALIAFQNEPLPDNGAINYVNWWQSQRELYAFVETLSVGSGVTSITGTSRGLVSAEVITPTVADTGDVIVDLPNIQIDTDTVIIGSSTPDIVDVGSSSTIVGDQALGLFTGSGIRNTCIGTSSLTNATNAFTDENTVIGAFALASTTGSVSKTVAIGYQVAENHTGTLNGDVLIGSNVLGNGGSLSGGSNIYIGLNAVTNMNDASSIRSIAMGVSVGSGVQRMRESIVLGYTAGGSSIGAGSLGIESSVVIGPNTGSGSGSLLNSVAIGELSGGGSGDKSDAICIGRITGNSGQDITNCIMMGTVVGVTHDSAHENTIMMLGNPSSWDDGTDSIFIGESVDSPIANISNYLNVGTVLTGDIANQKGAIGAGNTIDITPQLAKFGAYTTSELVAASAVHSADGTHPAIVKTFVTDRDPSTVITGAPGDLCVVSDGVSSTIFQHIGASASNSDWSTLGGGASTFAGLSDTPGGITADQFLVGNAGGTALEFVSNLNLQDANISNLNTVSFNSTHDNGNVSGVVGIDFAANGQKQEMTLTGNVTALTFTFPSGVASGFVLMISQDGTGGRTIAFGAGASKQARGGDLSLSGGSSTVTAMFIHWDGSVATITTIPDLQTSPTITNI